MYVTIYMYKQSILYALFCCIYICIYTIFINICVLYIYCGYFSVIPILYNMYIVQCTVYTYIYVKTQRVLNT